MDEKKEILRLLKEIRIDMNLLKTKLIKHDKIDAEKILNNIYSKFSNIETYSIKLEKLK